jgi:uncharacterized membrane protein
VDIPVWRIPRVKKQLVEAAAVSGVWGWTPRFHRLQRDTVVAVNLGGCLVPLGLALWETARLVGAGGRPLAALAVIVLANTVVCYLAACPVRGVGILIPWPVSPAVAIGPTWLLLEPTEFQAVRAPAAFAGGVLGPLLGADLLHLRDVTKVSARLASIGGAGTFDAIVLSGALAALLA